jgi:hypothetical protein
MARLRSGRVTRAQLELAARLGSVEAGLVAALPEAGGPGAWVRALRGGGEAVLLQVALSAAWYACPVWEDSARVVQLGGVWGCHCGWCRSVRRARWEYEPEVDLERYSRWLELVERWLRAPTPEVEAACRRAGEQLEEGPALRSGYRFEPEHAGAVAQACAWTLRAALRAVDGDPTEDVVVEALEAATTAVSSGWAYPHAEAWRLVREAAGAGARLALGLD